MKFLLLLLSLSSFAKVNVDINVNQIIDNKTVEITKTIEADFGKEIVINSNDNKQIVLKLNKFENVSVNGKKINPIQVDLKLKNSKNMPIGKSQTVTSFYQNSAEFSLNSLGDVNRPADLNVKLKFAETSDLVN